MNCFKPINITDPHNPTLRISVPCGRCAACLSNKANDWVTRLKIEQLCSSSAYFLTLTYADPWLPINNYGNPGFSLRDMTLFLKRLRSKVPDKLRYYYVCEYGKDTHRPHYHMILFNWPHEKDLMSAVADCWIDSRGRLMSMITDKNVGLLTDNGVTYVTKYILKKQNILPGDDVPFMKCSTRPGIGFSFLTDEVIRFYRDNPSELIFIAGEQRLMPRYIKDKIYDTPELRYRLLLSKQRYVNTKLDKSVTADFRRYGFLNNTYKVVSENVDRDTGEIYYRLEDRGLLVGNTSAYHDLVKARIADFNHRFGVKKRNSYHF